MNKIIEINKQSAISISGANESLRELISNHPDYPIVLAADFSNEDNYGPGLILCNGLSVQVSDLLDTLIVGADCAFLKREDFIQFVAAKVRATLEPLCLPDFEIEEQISEAINEAEPFWKKCILLIIKL